MEDFNLDDFAKSLKQRLIDFMPTDTGEMKTNALGLNPIMSIGDMKVFEIGSARAEREVPYYHILEDAQVISKRGKGTKRTKGSQDTIATKSKRDYGQVTIKINSKGNQSIYTEYRKNVRGNRSLVEKATKKIKYRDINGEIRSITKNADSKYYFNEHYHYIENELDNIVCDLLCQEFNLKLGRKKTDNSEVEMAHIFGDIVNVDSDYYVEDYFEDDYSY